MPFKPGLPRILAAFPRKTSLDGIDATLATISFGKQKITQDPHCEPLRDFALHLTQVGIYQVHSWKALGAQLECIGCTGGMYLSV